MGKCLPLASITTRRKSSNILSRYEDIEDSLLDFQNKLKDATEASHEGKKKHETTWEVFQLHHAREYCRP